MSFKMKFLPDRLVWTLWRRYKVRRSVASFEASPISYCCERTKFAGYHTIKKWTELYNTQVGRFTYFAENVRVRNCVMGPFCSIGAHVIIGELAKHPTGMISTHPLMYSASPVCGIVFVKKTRIVEFESVFVGADVFIGTHAMIFPGISLGVGSIVAAGAVVTKNVPPYAIVAGVPAKIIRYRFSEEVISELIKTEWWNWELSKLKKLQSLIGDVNIVSVDQIKLACAECARNGDSL